ncbi:hypothetical protein MJH12_08670 [bacterium]|nr:hypothetical protein [bacterium]
MAYQSAYCAHRSTSLLYASLKIQNPLTEQEKTSNKILVSSIIQTSKFSYFEILDLMEEFQTIKRPSLYQHNEYKRAILNLANSYEENRSKALFFIKRKASKQSYLSKNYKNRSHSLHRFYSFSNREVQKIASIFRDKLSRDQCQKFQSQLTKDIKSYDLIHDSNTTAFDSSVDLPESLSIFRQVNIKNGYVYSERIIEACLKVSPIKYSGN